MKGAFMKVFKISTALQLLYCLACLVLALWMPLYSAYYTTDFGRICLKVGGVLFFDFRLQPDGVNMLGGKLGGVLLHRFKKIKKGLGLGYYRANFDSFVLGTCHNLVYFTHRRGVICSSCKIKEQRTPVGVLSL